MKIASRIAAAPLLLALLASAPPERVSPFPALSTLKGPDETTPWRIEPAVLKAESINDLEAVQRWSDSITRQVPVVLGGTAQTRAAYDRIMESLFEWAGADALQEARGDRTRSLVPRRLIGAVTSYLAVKPIADSIGDIRKATIERWIHSRASDAARTFGGPAQPGRDGRVLDYNNNLQATAATLAMEAYIITGDAKLRDWAIAGTREVLDEIDAEGFTSEIRRENPEAAEYFSHEVMIYVVATASMAQDNGDPSLWNYRGKKAGSASEPAILRAGLLLGRDMGGNYVTKRHAEKTGLAQNAYRRSYLVSPGVDGLLIPEGWQTTWIGQFLEAYRSESARPGYQRLRAARDYYRKNRISQFNGSVPLVRAMAYPHPLASGKPASFP
jgi:hypothetical protein